jgi:hypothetical protein
MVFGTCNMLWRIILDKLNRPPWARIEAVEDGISVKFGNSRTLYIYPDFDQAYAKVKREMEQGAKDQADTA